MEQRHPLCLKADAEKRTFNADRGPKAGCPIVTSCLSTLGWDSTAAEYEGFWVAKRFTSAGAATAVGKLRWSRARIVL